MESRIVRCVRFACRLEFIRVFVAISVDGSLYLDTCPELKPAILQFPFNHNYVTLLPEEICEPSGTPMRVVLALKDTDLRLSVELLLSEQPGIRILVAATDTQGMQALVESSKPDLLLVESDLPGEAIVDVLSKNKIQ